MQFAIYTLASIAIAASLIMAMMSYHECLRKTHVWHLCIADRLEKSYNIRHDLGMRMVQRQFPLHEYKFKNQIHPDLAAADLFWTNNSVGASGGKYLHDGYYNEQGKPYHLFENSNYGRVFIEA